MLVLKMSRRGLGMNRLFLAVLYGEAAGLNRSDRYCGVAELWILRMKAPLFRRKWFRNGNIFKDFMRSSALSDLFGKMSLAALLCSEFSLFEHASLHPSQTVEQ